MRRELIFFIAPAVALVGAFAAGFSLGMRGEAQAISSVGQAADDWRDKDALENSLAAQDAVARWRAKTGDDMRGRNIQMVYLLDRTCIKLAFEDISIGGEPVYCYKTVMDGSQIRETTDLVYDGSNVE